MLQWKTDSTAVTSSSSRNGQPNGQPPKKPAADSHPSGFRRTSVRGVREATRATLDTISRTVRTARRTFEGSHTERSLIGRVLKHIHSDSNTVTQSLEDRPAELYITTENLLTTLPSSTHFLLLPPNIRSYKPYVDLDSSSSSMPHGILTQKVDEWFQQATTSLQTAIKEWFSDLQTVKEVWSIRSFTRAWLSMSELNQVEVARLETILDDAYRDRVTEIWNTTLSSAEKSFQAQIDLSMDESVTKRW